MIQNNIIKYLAFILDEKIESCKNFIFNNYFTSCVFGNRYQTILIVLS